MEEKQVEKESLCRLCANKNDKMIGIYSEEGLTNDLANKMNLYLPVKVYKSDVLPLHCCWSCASTVLAWHELVIASVKADKKLREMEAFAQVQVADEAAKETEDGADDSNSFRSKPDSSAASLTAYNKTAANTSELQSQPRSRSSKKRLNKTETIIICEKIEDDILTDSIIKSDDEEELKMEIVDEVLEEEIEEEEEGDDKELREWIIKNEGFTYETEIITDIKQETVEKPAVEKQTNRERKRQTKIDQVKVNAAKVVVDGKVYYNCKICGKSLHSPYTFVWHMRIHTGERPFVCDLCGKQFRVSQGLVRHLKETHERIKNFKCDICGRMFATRRNVDEHRRIHTNERPYVCDLCGKSFKQKASLFVHNRSHSDTFPFKCSYCNQRFRTKPPLMIHITRHTGEKPYPCDICGRRFRIKYELKRHRLIHSDEKPFVCSECGLCFRQKRYLRNHSKINHGVVM